MRGLAAVAVLAGAFLGGACSSLPIGVRPDPQLAGNPDRVGPVVVVGTGANTNGAWRAWVYRTKDGSVCLEYSGGSEGGATCGPEDGMLAPTTGTLKGSAYVQGGTQQPGAAGAILRVTGGPPIRIGLVPAGIASPSGARYFFVVLARETFVDTVDIVDGTGQVLETLDVPGG